MHVVFGPNLDGLSYPETIRDGKACFGSLVAGPGALLNLLEMRLGLGQPAVTRAVRVAEYLSLLQRVDDNCKFYSASLSADAWATAQHLLALRDELIAAGWNGKSISGLRKVAALAEVEAEALAKPITPNSGERLTLVSEKMAGRSKRVVDIIQIVGGIERLSPVWRKAIVALAETGTTIEESLFDEGAARGDLKQLKRVLTACDTTAKATFVGDGSLSVVDADDELQAAELCAAWLASHISSSAGPNKVVIIRGADSSLLSQSCTRYGLPRIGNTTRSQFRALLQVLPLAFELVLRPIDPKKLVEFLCIEGGPVPGWVSEKIIRALGEAPGIGGTHWRAAWAKCTELQSEWIARYSPGLSSEECQSEAIAKIEPLQVWFQEMVSSGSTSIRKENVIAICERVQRWASGRAPFDDNGTLYEVAAAQAKMLRRLFSERSALEVSISQLRKMIEAVGSYGVTVTTTEAADWSLVDEPGQIWAPASTVLWWGFAQPQWSIGRSATWSNEDMEVLRSNGVELERPIEKLRRESYGWRAPILNAGDRLVLVKPRVVGGQRAVPHPLWDEITSLVEEKSVPKVMVRGADLFARNELQMAGASVACEQRNHVSLPRQLRTWSLPEGAVKARKRESFSSIEKLLGCSLAWTLQYSAGMWQPKAIDLPEKQLLLGKLAHAVVKILYDEKPQWEPKSAHKFASELLPTLIPEMAAGLLLPGASPQLREAMEAIPDSVRQLSKFLHEAGATVEACEKNLKARINDNTELAGDVDMLIRLPSGNRAVLDFKWSSSPYYYRKRLVDGQALQLAIYSWLATQIDTAEVDVDSKIGPAGFFMFRHAELFFTEDGIFPQYTFVRRMARSLDETWKVTLEAYDRVFAEVRSGMVVATGIKDDTVPIEAFIHPELVKPPCDFCKLTHFCGKRELQ